MNIHVLSAEELAALLKQHVHSLLTVDTRSLMQYNDNHIQNAINICCSKIIRRKLQSNKIRMQDVLKSHGFDWRLLKLVVIYDESSYWGSGNNFNCNHVLFILAQKLLEIVPDVVLLEGMFVFNVLEKLF